MKFLKRRKAAPKDSAGQHAKPAVPFLNCRENFDPEVLAGNLPALVGQISEAAPALQGRAQNDLYEIAYTAQMLAAYFADISLGARNEIYSDTISHSAERLQLFTQVHDLLMEQLASDIPYVYETGYLYQGIDGLVLMGSRDAEQRYHNYQFYNHLTPGMRLLDVGANCGFMGLFAARNLGCHAVCMDHNPYMLEVGRLLGRHFDVEERLTFVTSRIQDMTPAPHDAVFSFASHWTDDGGIRNTLLDHFALLMRFLTPGGKLFFESHCNDLTDNNYEASVEQVSREFGLRIAFRRLLDNNTRDYIVFEHQA